MEKFEISIEIVMELKLYEMPHTEIYIHAVWSTKNRNPYLSKSIRWKIFDHIRENSRKKEIYLDFINGYVDHVHCLIGLSPNQKVSKVIQLIKGESTHWINQNGLIEYYFSWQKEYYAISVGVNELKRVRKYIKNQEYHHKNNGFSKEISDLFGVPLIS